MRSIKLHIIKYTAISIGLLYVLHPLQNQIQNGLHAISHAIEAQTTVTPHSHTHTATIVSHSHSQTQKHEHQIIGFFNDVFGTADKDVNDPLVFDITIDKHILNQLYVTVKKYTIPTIPYFYKIPDKTSNGYLVALEKPPQSVLA